MLTSPIRNYCILITWILPLFSYSCNNTDENSRADKDWSVYLGNNHSTHYSSLSGINPENIKNLAPAWEYHTGDDITENRSQIQCNPLIIEGILYGTSPKLKVFALNAQTGKLVWEFDPEPASKAAKNVNRGVAFWQKGEHKRILFSSGHELFSLDAVTGKPDKGFGESGKISLREGLGEKAKDLYIAATSPGIVYRDLLIIGSRVSENAGAAPGHIRAYNIITGKLEWVFNTIPRPGEFGYETWPDSAYHTAGGANSWAGMSLDPDAGIVYAPTGSAAFDFWGGNRKGENLFANCILALDAKTGKRIWHFQTIHHDIWDRDLPAPPNLVTVNHNGKKIKALAQITKSGFIFVLDRKTGKPLYPVNEMPVPGSSLDGEETWPTQPIPSSPAPFTRQVFTEDDINDMDKGIHDSILNIFRKIRSGSMFAAPGTEGTLIFPGFDGGGEWGGAAVDPQKGILYVNSNIMPWILTMVDIRKSLRGELTYKVNCAVCHGPEMKGDPSGTYPDLSDITRKRSKEEILTVINSGRGVMPSFKHLTQNEKAELIEFITEGIQLSENSREASAEIKLAVPYSHTGYNRFLDNDGYPAIKPPWGTLSAVDLNKGTLLWQVPLGEFEELTVKGIPQTGTENYGGPAVTAGGIIFIGASKDGYFRAFDKQTGKELWKYKLPAGGYATPGIYEAGGKEYVVIACGGGKMGTKSGDSYVAFTIK